MTKSDICKYKAHLFNNKTVRSSWTWLFATKINTVQTPYCWTFHHSHTEPHLIMLEGHLLKKKSHKSSFNLLWSSLIKKNWVPNEHQISCENEGAIKTLNLLHKTCGQVALRAHVFEWHKEFPKGTENVEDEWHHCPLTVKSDENGEKIRTVMKTHCHSATWIEVLTKL